MDRALGELIQYLNMEKEIYLKIRELSVAKKEAVINGSLEELSEIIVEEKSLIDRIEVIEAKRDETAEFLSGELNIDSSDITVAKIIEELGNNYTPLKRQLENLLNDFNKIFTIQKELNKTNNSVLSKNISYVRFIMNTVMYGNESLTYGSEGNSSKSQKLNIFDQRV